MIRARVVDEYVGDTFPRSIHTFCVTQYVLGFLFSSDRKHVALIRKNKPDWQKGKLNGIGGKIEPFDKTSLDAMIREFREEADVLVVDWQPFAELSRVGETDTCVFCFRAFGEVSLRSATDELVAWQPVNKLDKSACLPNLRWLVPLALDETTIHTESIF